MRETNDIHLATCNEGGEVFTEVSLPGFLSFMEKNSFDLRRD